MRWHCKRAVDRETAGGLSCVVLLFSSASLSAFGPCPCRCPLSSLSHLPPLSLLCPSLVPHDAPSSRPIENHNEEDTREVRACVRACALGLGAWTRACVCVPFLANKVMRLRLRIAVAVCGSRVRCWVLGVGVVSRCAVVGDRALRTLPLYYYYSPASCCLLALHCRYRRLLLPALAPRSAGEGAEAPVASVPLPWLSSRRRPSRRCAMRCLLRSRLRFCSASFSSRERSVRAICMSSSVLFFRIRSYFAHFSSSALSSAATFARWTWTRDKAPS